MALTLNHYSIRTTDIDANRDFYAQVLGLTVGPRPIRHLQQGRLREENRIPLGS